MNTLSLRRCGSTILTISTNKSAVNQYRGATARRPHPHGSLRRRVNIRPTAIFRVKVEPLNDLLCTSACSFARQNASTPKRKLYQDGWHIYVSCPSAPLLPRIKFVSNVRCAYCRRHPETPWSPSEPLYWPKRAPQSKHILRVLPATKIISLFGQFRMMLLSLEPVLLFEPAPFISVSPLNSSSSESRSSEIHF